MRAMRRFAASVVVSHGLTGSAARRLTARASAAWGSAARQPTARQPSARQPSARAFPARAFTARGAAILRAAALGLIALIAGTSVVLVSLAASTVVALGTAPALATVASAPRVALASVIPSTAAPQSRVTFAVYCTSARATSATLAGRTLGLTEHIKMRPNRGAGDFTVAVILPGSIQPGSYHPSIKCSDGTSTSARLLVPALGAAGGSSDGIGTWLTAGGLVLIGLGTVTGSIVLRRRRRSGHTDWSDEPDESAAPAVHSDRFDYSGHSNFRFLTRRGPGRGSLRFHCDPGRPADAIRHDP